MNKNELSTALVNKTELSKKDADKFVNAFIEVVSETLSAGEKIQLIGFGTFEVKDRPARVAHNPRTREEIQIAAAKAPVFKAGKALKDAVNK
ncbi:MAG: HU family DNA-binding protein [Clostridia bacterium]|nr:HU family DNA-binding protein [Clostridia bacterium]